MASGLSPDYLLTRFYAHPGLFSFPFFRQSVMSRVSWVSFFKYLDTLFSAWTSLGAPTARMVCPSRVPMLKGLILPTILGTQSSLGLSLANFFSPFKKQLRYQLPWEVSIRTHPEIQTPFSVFKYCEFMVGGWFHR